MKTVHGDLLKLFQDGEFDVLVHGANCHNTFGAGIALQIKKQYPIAYEVDCRTKKGDARKLGSLSIASIINPMCEEQQYIANAYIQKDYGTHKRQVNYDALRNCFLNVKMAFEGKRIGYPMIGAGLAGGDWKVISKIISEELEGEDHTLVIYKP